VTTSASSRTRLEALGVTKTFGSLRALSDVDFAVEGGEVHVLVGENGAGKSTLVSLLNGSRGPDAGSVRVGGTVLPLPDPKAALEHGVVTEHQELSLVTTMTGLENVALAIGKPAGRATRALARSLCDRYGLSVELAQPVHEMEMPARQRLALLRALCQRPRFLLLDEPTTFLPPTEIPTFLETVRSLAADGLGIVLISHRMDEVRAAADRVTVLRQGEVVAALASGEIPSGRELAALIAGHEVREVTPGDRPAGEQRIAAEDLEVRDGRRTVVDGVRLAAAGGTIVGLAGVDGNGQEPLLLALAGLMRPAAGRVVHGDDDVTGWPVRRRMAAGIRSVPANRREGVVPGLTIAEHFRIAGLLRDPGVLPGLLERYDIRPADPGARADRLSGGNQQKLLLALAIEQPGDVLLLPYPTSGLDVDAQARVHTMLIDEARRGAAVVVASGDLDELMTLCDRIVVLNRGRIAGEQSRAEFDSQQLIRWFIDAGDRERVAHAAA
jgi:ABC-type uncharacterized transport system ATPase subunit